MKATLPNFKTTEEKDAYKRFLSTIVREIRSLLYQRVQLIPMENQDFFMNIRNLEVKRSPENNLTVIYFNSQGKRYGLLIEEKKGVIHLFETKTKEVIMKVSNYEVDFIKEPLVENKKDLYLKQDPFGTFFCRSYKDWVEQAKKLGDAIKIV